MPNLKDDDVGIVVIGRNEGERLKSCLHSLNEANAIVYVDSGSTDGSQDFARLLGVEVIDLKIPPGFTAARARNVGMAALNSRWPNMAFVQMVDGDCEIAPGWLDSAQARLRSDDRLALVFGRLRERHPERSIYNALCDYEWDGPIGEAPGSGGIAMFRVAALQQVDGYVETMIAGEDTEMAMRMRKKGWRLERLDCEMGFHDAAITSFSQWWQRAKRGGHGFAEMAHLHPDAKWPNWRRTCRSICFWGAGVPAAIASMVVLASITGSGPAGLAAIALVVAYPLQAARIALNERRRGLRLGLAVSSAILLTLGKIAEFLGLARFHINRIRGRRSLLIEHKIGGA